MRQFLLLFSITVIFLSGCVQTFANEQEDMLVLASALTKLSSAVESTVRYKNPPDNATEIELLELSTQHDPRLLAPFEDYQIRVMTESRHAIVLICTADGTRRLLEDVGCSAELDFHHWEESVSNQCEFSLNVLEICSN